MDEILFADPAVFGFDASLNYEYGKYTLQLIIEAKGRLDLASLAACLPQELNIEIKYDHADPFSHRGKRQIHYLPGTIG